MIQRKFDKPIQRVPVFQSGSGDWLSDGYYHVPFYLDLKANKGGNIRDLDGKSITINEWFLKFEDRSN